MMCTKKGEPTLKPCDKRCIVQAVRLERPKDISKACRLIKLSRSSLRYQSIKNDGYIMERLEELAKQNPVEGFWKCYGRIRNSGTIVNHKNYTGFIKDGIAAAP
ncbi:hypothetical protein [Ferruginibacter sp.]|nr:hypothetical protein [Ferruginibacter sp.]